MTITEIAVDVRLQLCIEHSRFIDGVDDPAEEQRLLDKINRMHDWLWKRQQREWTD